MKEINKRVFTLLGEERGSCSQFARFLNVKDSNISNWKIRGSEIPAKYYTFISSKEKEDAAKKINKVLMGKTSMAKKWLNKPRKLKKH